MNSWIGAQFKPVPTARLKTFFGSFYILMVGVLDFSMPHSMSFSLFYVLGIGYVAWRVGKGPAIALAVISAILMDLDDWHRVQALSRWVPFWNTASRAALFSGAGWCIARLTRLNLELHSAVKEKIGQYRAIMTTTLDGFALINAGGRIADVNDVYCSFLGYSHEELVGKTIHDVEAQETTEEIQAHLRRIRSQGSDRFETVQRRKDGCCIDVEVSVTSVPGSDGAMVCFLRDITQRKQAQAQLRESEERYRSLSESSPDAILVLNRESRILYANVAAAAPWNHAPGQIIGLRQHELFPPKIAEAHSELLRKVFETGELICSDELIPFPTGDRWNETRLVPVFGPGKNVQSVIVIAVDISERKRTEWLLEAQRDLGLKLSGTSDMNTALKALLQVVIQIQGIDCGGVYFRDETTTELKIAAHEGAMSDAFLQRVLVHPPDSVRAQLVSKGQPIYDAYAQIPLIPDPDDQHLRSAALIPFSHEGKVIGSLHLGSRTHTLIPIQSRIFIEAVVAQAAGAIARIRSENERRRLEDQLLDISDREQARMGQEIHDGLCQQLVSLAFDANSLQSELVQAARSESALASRIVHYLDDAITEARHLSRGLFPIRLQSEGLPSALKELARGVTARFGVSCQAVCEERVSLDNPSAAIHIYRIAQEAVTNAIKHSHARSITIRLERTDGELTLLVEDDGVGLNPSPSATTSGMGLHIMDYRARTLGGTIRFRPGNGKGSSICCCLPVRASEK